MNNVDVLNQRKQNIRVIPVVKQYIAFDPEEYLLNGEKAEPVVSILEPIVRMICDDQNIQFNDSWNCAEVLYHVIKIAPKTIINQMVCKTELISFEENKYIKR